jgi:hypothetical protein
MKINGLKVDTAAIGNGLYQIICETGREAIVAFGMIPADLMATTEKMLREKIIALSAKQIGCTVEEYKPFIDEQKVKETINPILHEISLAIYNAASKAGKMIV